MLTNSYYAKLLAVKSVTKNKGERTAGIDGAKLLTPNSGMNAALKLSGKKYKVKTLRRVYMRQQQIIARLASGSMDVRRMHANMLLFALAARIQHNGFWKGISKDVLIISTMNGFWTTSRCISRS